MLAIALLFLLISGRPGMSDEDQIHALLANCESSVERKDLKGMLSCISIKYSDPSGNDYNSIRLLALQASRYDGKYDIVLQGTIIDIHGNTAKVNTQVYVSLLEDNTMQPIFSDAVDLSLSKETSKHWLVFTRKKWKITKISHLPGTEL